jgi:predicted nucleic acid-binding protein
MFLGWFQNEPDKIEGCRSVIRLAESDQLSIVTSALTIAEVLAVQGAAKIPREMAEKVRDFFKHKYIVIRDLDRATAERARELVWQYGVSPKDAIHVATALSMQAYMPSGLDQFDTYDEGLVAKSRSFDAQPPLPFGPPNVQGSLF